MRRRAATRRTVVLLRLAGFEVSLRHCRPTTPTQITQIPARQPGRHREAAGGCRTRVPECPARFLLREGVPTAPTPHRSPLREDPLAATHNGTSHGHSAGSRRTPNRRCSVLGCCGTATATYRRGDGELVVSKSSPRNVIVANREQAPFAVHFESLR